MKHAKTVVFTVLVFSIQIATFISCFPTEIQSTTPSKFLIGVNLPFLTYGDLGKRTGVPIQTSAIPQTNTPQQTPANPNAFKVHGYACNYDRLLQNLIAIKKVDVDIDRAFGHCDLRSGAIFNEKNEFVDFDKDVFPDLYALFKAHKEADLLIIYSVLDFLVADDGLVGNPNYEYPQIITDPKQRRKFIEAERKLLVKLKEFEPWIYAIEPMNEPENARYFFSHKKVEDLKAYMREMKSMIKSVFPNTYVTVGSSSSDNLSELWYSEEFGDLYQFHHYKNFEKLGMRFNTSKDKILETTKPVLIGETEGERIGTKCKQARANGYSGILFWSWMNLDHNTKLTIERLRQCKP